MQSYRLYEKQREIQTFHFPLIIDVLCVLHNFLSQSFSLRAFFLFSFFAYSFWIPSVCIRHSANEDERKKHKRQINFSTLRVDAYTHISMHNEYDIDFKSFIRMKVFIINEHSFDTFHAIDLIMLISLTLSF